MHDVLRIFPTHSPAGNSQRLPPGDHRSLYYLRVCERVALGVEPEGGDEGRRRQILLMGGEVPAQRKGISAVDEEGLRERDKSQINGIERQ